MSQITEIALANALKKQMQNKPLNKITVKDIADECGVNRQTFYYHFHDVFELVEWIYNKDALKAIDNKKTYENWHEGFINLFEYIKDNKNFVVSTYHSISRSYLENYLYNEVYKLIIDVVEEQAKGKKVSEEDKIFIANFYKFAFVGLMLDWVKNGMKDNPEYIVGRLSILIQGDINKAIDKFCRKD